MGPVWKVMAAHRWVYDSRHLQADCQEPGSAAELYARYSSMGYLYLFTATACYLCKRALAFSANVTFTVFVYYDALHVSSF